MTFQEIEDVIERSGIRIGSYDALGNGFDLDTHEIAKMFTTMNREDLTAEDKAIMLCGILHFPAGI